MIAAASMTAGVGCTTGARLPPPPVASTPPREPECTPAVLDEPQGAEPPPARRSWGAPVDLADLLVPPPARGRAAPRQRIDLGHLSPALGPLQPTGGIDSAPLTLPHDVPRPDLTPDLQRLWDRDEATLREQRRAQAGQARAERRERACAPAGCAELACLGKLKRAFDEEAAAIRARRARERGELIASLRRALDAAGDKAPAGVALALASKMEDVARETDGSIVDFARLAREPIAMYQRAAALGGPATSAGFYIRYLRAVLLDDTGDAEGARAAFTALAQASPPGRRAAQATYEAAHLERDPDRAADGFQRAAATAEKGSAIRDIALDHWARAALRIERPADALTASRQRLDELPALDGDTDGSLPTIAETMAIAFGRLAVQRASVPAGKVPSDVFAMIAAQVAKDALARFDADQALHAARVLAPHARRPEEASALAKRAEDLRDHRDTTPPRLDLERRLGALLDACSKDHGITDAPLRVTLAVDTAPSGAPEVTVRPVKPRPPSPLQRCLQARGPAYFAGATADLRVKLTLNDR